MTTDPRRIQPEPGQESVWDYPRPPRLQRSRKQVKVILNRTIIANSHKTYRVLETSHPPVYYIPPEDIQMEYLQKTTSQKSWCEWKGFANYYTVTVGEREVINGAWYYPQPSAEFETIKNYVAFYPSKMDACYLDDQQVQPQAGDYYGGWITRDIVGPFKGDVGTWGW